MSAPVARPAAATSRSGLPTSGDHPAIHPNYLATEFDLREALEGVRLVRALVKTPALSALIERDLKPWPRGDSDDELIAHMRQVARTTYHPVGTCAMGPDAATAVVDQRLRLHGLAAIRVVDASIMPLIISGNTTPRRS